MKSDSYSERGPVPKRNAETAGHKGQSQRPDSVTKRGAVKVPQVRHSWGEETKTWYRAIKESGQSIFYEPSDWQQALLLGDMYQVLQGGGGSASLLSAFLKGCDDLGLTERARRRMHIEVERVSTDEEADESAEEALAELRLLEDEG